MARHFVSLHAEAHASRASAAAAARHHRLVTEAKTMKKIPKAIYQTADEIDAQIRERQATAHQLADSSARQAILKDIAQLRMYAEAKRWTSRQT